MDNGGVRNLGKDMEDYLIEGMVGSLETKPDERRKYLGTIRERVIVALTHGQVREKGPYIDELQKIMKEHSKAKMFLNGSIEYQSLSPYVKLATKQNLPYTITMNGDYNSDLGLVLAYDHAIDKENIMLTINNEPDLEDEQEESGIKKFFDKLF